MTIDQMRQEPVPRPDTNALAVAALVLGIVWLAGLGALLAIIFGAIALRQIKHTRESGRGLAVAGLTLGAVGIVVPAVLVAAVIAASNSSNPDRTFGRPLPIPSASAQPVVTGLPPCGPAPCADYQGFVLQVAAVKRDLYPGAGGMDTPGPGFHLVRVTISFSDVTGEHGYNEGFDLSLIDSTGTAQSGLSTGDGQGCPTFLPVAQDMAPGGHSGPFDVCYPAGGPVRGPLTLAWTPDFNMTGCESLPAGVEPKPTGILVRADGCDAILISLGT